jgi:thiol-disulfide isomerase/thioredoxin
MNINYSRIARAIEFYQQEGYFYLEVPWTVDYVSITQTAPTNSKLFYLKNKYLVASAEQSFISLLNNLDPNMKYVACTPCFRDELVYDDFHQLYFMKIELFALKQIEHLAIAKKFFEKELSVYSDCIEEKQEEFGTDLLVSGIEIGSYYSRENYSCGTGLAEPRFSQAIEITYK